MMKFSDFGFQENPFSITPDPRYLYLSRGHEESLAHLIYGTGPNGGFVLLTGEVGTGKTLLIRSLLAQQLGEVDIALVLNPRLSRREFIATIIDELGIHYEGHPYSLKEMTDALTRHLLKTHSEGRHTVLVVDEAQNLSPRVLEQVRLLTNLETTRHKLLRIILVGQPELLQMLARKEMRQVDQRITARYHLSPLERAETARYITHRLAVAGIREDLFTPAAMRLIHRLSGGVPRRINTLCERTLLAIFSRGRQRAGVTLVWQAAREVKGKKAAPSLRRWVLPGLLLAGLVGLVGYLQWPDSREGVDAVDAEVADASALMSEAQTPVSLQTAESVKLSLPEASSVMQAVQEPPPPAPAAAPAAEAAPEPESAPESDPVAAAPVQADASPPEDPIPEAAEHRFDPERLFTESQAMERLYRPLFSLWGESYQPDSPLTPCMQAPLKGLRCLREQGSWRQIEALDRPLLLRLVREKQSRLLLVKLKQNDLLVVDDGVGEALIELAELEPYWQGEYVLLWRPPQGVALIGEGSAGEAVTWLRRQLQRFDQQPLTPVVGLDRFDPALKRRLQAFQRTRGLLEDGVAGQQTLIYLNNLAPAPGTPRLMVETGEGGDVADTGGPEEGGASAPAG